MEAWVDGQVVGLQKEEEVGVGNFVGVSVVVAEKMLYLPLQLRVVGAVVGSVFDFVKVVEVES